MNRMQMTIGRPQKVVALFVVVVIGLGCALVAASLLSFVLPLDTGISSSSPQNPTVKPVFGMSTSSVSSPSDREKLYLTVIADLYEWRNNTADIQGSLIPLDSTSTIISYARKHEDQIFIVVLNNSAANQSIVINLGSRWISCSRVKNILMENDPKIWLNHPGSGIDSLSVKLNAWESKIIECEQETSSLTVDHPIPNLFSGKVL